MYDLNYTAIVEGATYFDPVKRDVSCRSGWEYNTDEVSSSIVIDVRRVLSCRRCYSRSYLVLFLLQFDLVCSKSFYPTLGLFALNLGGLVGVLLFGYLNDRCVPTAPSSTINDDDIQTTFYRLGRKRNYFLCLTVMIAFGIATPFAPDMTSWCIFRFFVGLTIPAILHIPFVICKPPWFLCQILRLGFNFLQSSVVLLLVLKVLKWWRQPSAPW